MKKNTPLLLAMLIVLVLCTAGNVWKGIAENEARESAERRADDNKKQQDELKKNLDAIAWQLAGITGREIDGASLEGIQRGISDLKAMVKPKPWGLTQEQLATLTRKMAPFSSAEDRGNLITASMSDPDSVKFGFNLVAAFRAANWTLSGSGLSRAELSGHVTGITAVFHSQGSDPPGLREFVATLREAGIEVIGQIDDKIPSDRFRIIVGSKPGD